MPLDACHGSMDMMLMADVGWLIGYLVNQLIIWLLKLLLITTTISTILDTYTTEHGVSSATISLPHHRTSRACPFFFC